MPLTAQGMLKRIDSCVKFVRQEPDDHCRMTSLRDLEDLRKDVEAEDPDGVMNKFTTTMRIIVRHYPALRGIMSAHEHASEESRKRRIAAQAMQSSPSLAVASQYGQSRRQMANSASAVALTPQQPLYTTIPTSPSFSDPRSFGQHVNTQHLHPGRPTAEYITSTSQGPNMPPSTEQQRGNVQGHIGGGQQYRQPQRGAPPRGGSMHRFAPPNAPGPNMAPSAEQHQAYVPEHIMTYQEMQYVERQTNEDQMRPPMATQGPGMGQYHQPNVLPQGQYSLSPPPRPTQRQSAFVQHEVQAQGSINARAGPSHTRSQTVASGNTFGHGLPGQLGFSAYDRRGDSLDSDGNTIPRTSYSSEGSYQSHGYRQN
ncbi:hypothetical protein PILCRDRAFT_255245 [Piloderma croceum F 1598]|uniref:Uncharacterized protein n=1 Tax=Piloderma croceum (strain F 1598) TaxID=765440 RepID=A0A0C3FVA5_PILCF|nr:hypothetical protein PILCRDRAFT_255245 [Piloderma croceum F 1598]